jgi:hypothetical protein
MGDVGSQGRVCAGAGFAFLRVPAAGNFREVSTILGRHGTIRTDFNCFALKGAG